MHSRSRIPDPGQIDVVRQGRIVIPGLGFGIQRIDIRHIIGAPAVITQRHQQEDLLPVRQFLQAGCLEIRFGLHPGRQGAYQHRPGIFQLRRQIGQKDSLVIVHGHPFPEQSGNKHPVQMFMIHLKCIHFPGKFPDFHICFSLCRTTRLLLLYRSRQ